MFLSNETQVVLKADVPTDLGRVAEGPQVRADSVHSYHVTSKRGAGRTLVYTGWDVVYADQSAQTRFTGHARSLEFCGESEPLDDSVVEFYEELPRVLVAPLRTSKGAGRGSEPPKVWLINGPESHERLALLRRRVVPAEAAHSAPAIGTKGFLLRATAKRDLAEQLKLIRKRPGFTNAWNIVVGIDRADRHGGVHLAVAWEILLHAHAGARVICAVDYRSAAARELRDALRCVGFEVVSEDVQGRQPRRRASAVLTGNKEALPQIPLRKAKEKKRRDIIDVECNPSDRARVAQMSSGIKAKLHAQGYSSASGQNRFPNDLASVSPKNSSVTGSCSGAETSVRVRGGQKGPPALKKFEVESTSDRTAIRVGVGSGGNNRHGQQLSIEDDEVSTLLRPERSNSFDQRRSRREPVDHESVLAMGEPTDDVITDQDLVERARCSAAYRNAFAIQRLMMEKRAR
ncbi:hypothetical protein [Caballeronia sp. J97]|uniref:hypothetical protein n=1 Tax=Caballeronia sp. J97 TaxID=2805429 RepID=UPI002AAFBB38|nr:hypothetical protein [Caballeronia sp. J97]